MRFLHVILVHHSILQCRINALMTQKLLHLLDRHTLVDGHCSQRPTKLVRMYLIKVQFTTNFPETNFNTADLQTLVRLQKGYKQRFVTICTF